MSEKVHKAGFVTIVGEPNVGKSTLMNQLAGERLSIITSKAQTTRHRILGIISGEDFQVVYSDTPGVLKPQYELHKSMMKFVNLSLEDADVILLVTSLEDKFDQELFDPILNTDVPVIHLINKTDLAKGSQVKDKTDYWAKFIDAARVIPISALNGDNIDEVFQAIIELLPEHPAYFPKDSLTDKPEHFFAAEIIREKLFLNYKQEVPYSCEVAVEEFKEDEKIIRIRAIIFVERKSQKGIIIGKGGSALKKVGIDSRADLEAFFGKQVHLETYVKIAENWRKESKRLRYFGYNE
ncbi:MAG: GTPase Era [Bacteroidota bacterium]